VDPSQLVVPLSGAGSLDSAIVGGKASNLGRLIQGGHRVPEGFCITTAAYDLFLRENGLAKTIQMEIGRKRLSKMRWEEIWDAALRLRTRFLKAPVPVPISVEALSRAWALNPPLAVRSSAPGEDSASMSYAGLHESVTNVKGDEDLLDAIRVVWASLWSDAALLYRRELGLDPLRSRMAVVVQEMVSAEESGVGFGVDPRNASNDREVIEAVPGPCSDLVDGVVDPDRWILRRASGEVLEWKPGVVDGAPRESPVLDMEDLESLHSTIEEVRSLFGWDPDIEWTGKRSKLTLLQARPVTLPGGAKESDEREWYMSLRPGCSRLEKLRRRVAEELIPELEAEGMALASESLHGYDDDELAAAIWRRKETLDRWRQIYWDEFIPFAHGVRQLAVYYNDAVKPEDPYEFVELLQGQEMIATVRNRSMVELAREIRKDEVLLDALTKHTSQSRAEGTLTLETIEAGLQGLEGGPAMASRLRGIATDFLSITYSGQRLDSRLDLALAALLELARAPAGQGAAKAAEEERKPKPGELEARLLEAVGDDRREEAKSVLEIARLSWRLRDDDNVLIGRVENQLLRALELAAARLRERGVLGEEQRVTMKAAETLAEALRESGPDPLRLPVEESPPEKAKLGPGESPRQIIGQPASPGIATGVARIVRSAEDLGRFHAGEILVCDAIQPAITHLVPLASAIVERRGGMLIHGAIIARELGIPCVNGAENAAEILHDGDLLTVDGYLGIVTVGPPEFDLETGAKRL
jgi:pyruvate,water dikinase